MLNFMQLQKEVEDHYKEEPRFSSIDFLNDCVEWLNNRPECLNENVNVFGLLIEYLEHLNSESTTETKDIVEEQK